MTLKEIDKKLKRIKKELQQIEITVRKEKSRKKKKTTLEDWLGLRDKVSSEWDKNVTVKEEINYQREKNW